MLACVSETTDQTKTNTTTSTETITTSFTEELTTTTQTTTQTTTFVPVDSATIETDQATFNVQINTITIDDSFPVVTVVVEITAKVNIDQVLETSSWGIEGLIRMRIISVDDTETELYSELFDTLTTEDTLNVHLDTDDSLTKSLQFARTPFHFVPGVDPSPTGSYKVQVALYSIDMGWINTGLLITVT